MLASISGFSQNRWKYHWGFNKYYSLQADTIYTPVINAFIYGDATGKVSPATISYGLIYALGSLSVDTSTISTKANVTALINNSKYWTPISNSTVTTVSPVTSFSVTGNGTLIGGLSASTVTLTTNATAIVISATGTIRTRATTASNLPVGMEIGTQSANALNLISSGNAGSILAHVGIMAFNGSSYVPSVRVYNSTGGASPAGPILLLNADIPFNSAHNGRTYIGYNWQFDTVKISGITYINAPLLVNRASTIDTLAITSNATVGGNLTVTGDTKLNAQAGTAGTDSVLVSHGGVVRTIAPTYYSTGGGGTNFWKDSSGFLAPATGYGGRSIFTTGGATFGSTINSTVGNNSVLFNASGATTGYQFFQISNTAASLFMGLESSSGGAIATGSTANSTVIRGLGIGLSSDAGASTGFKISSSNALTNSGSITGLNLISTTNLNGQHLVGTTSSGSSTGLGVNVSSLTPSGNDISMTLTVVTSGIVAGTIGTINFNTVYAVTPKVVISCANSTTAVGTANLFANGTGTGTFIIGGNIASAGTYTYNVIIVQ